MTPRFHPVVLMPPWAIVLDLTTPRAAFAPSPSPWTIGRYDEDRTIYRQALFAGGRSIHMGIDLGGPVGTAVHAFAGGVVLHSGINRADGDYGGTVVTEHQVDGERLWALHGHLSHASVRLSHPGRRVEQGMVIGWLGDRTENGGWPPHVHFQLSVERPDTHDLPGAVAAEDREAARARFPDPRTVLGPLY